MAIDPISCASEPAFVPIATTSEFETPKYPVPIRIEASIGVIIVRFESVSILLSTTNAVVGFINRSVLVVMLPKVEVTCKLPPPPTPYGDTPVSIISLFAV